jgi:hypothetical protein
MWLSLTDSKLIETYRKEFITGQCPEEIAALLVDLSKKPYASNLWAVTSLGHLRLTTANSYRDCEKHDCIHVGRRNDAGKLVITISYVEKNRRKSTADRQCAPEETVGYVNLYAIRLIASAKD